MQPHAPLIIDIAGTELSAADETRLLNPLVGGIILFRRNWHNRQQLSQLNRQIKALRSDLLIAVDHEGGRVQRFQEDGFTHLPPMKALGDSYRREQAVGEQQAVAAGYVLASELRACGVDFSFTPVLDLDYGRSEVIGNRAFAAEPQVVATLARCLMYGLRLGGMANCAKHFPGHGFAVADSHVALPLDERNLEQLQQADIKPYGWLLPAIAAVMPAHIVYPQVDTKPAGFSAVWLQQILRRQLEFSGAVISDDLSMAAARQVDGQQLSFSQAAVLALNSGCDMVLLCNQSLHDGLLDEFISEMQHAKMQGHWQSDTAAENRRLALLPSAAPLSWQQLLAQPQYRFCRRQLQYFN